MKLEITRKEAIEINQSLHEAEKIGSAHLQYYVSKNLRAVKGEVQAIEKAERAIVNATDVVEFREKVGQVPAEDKAKREALTAQYFPAIRKMNNEHREFAEKFLEETVAIEFTAIPWSAMPVNVTGAVTSALFPLLTGDPPAPEKDAGLKKI
jgi:hypothetical protein